MAESSKAVFLSYASQDAEAARRIRDALRAAGIEVFFDQSELRGGDAWDQKIRREIRDCVLFIPIVSQHTQERLEGYFRLEWRLAVDRTHLMAERKAFLVPVVVDDTKEQDAEVPAAFRAVQWTRLFGSDTPPAFVERIKSLLSPVLSASSAGSTIAPAIRSSVPASSRSKLVLLALVALVVITMLAYFVADKFWMSKYVTPPATAFTPPAHSIAVLPFLNMSGDNEQEYFSDGLTEELLNSLAEINELQVAARTSAFSFKRKDTDIGTIARKLNVAAVLEGSVRRSGNTVRVTAQLINATTGFHLWSHTYDRDIGDVLKLETDIAGAVASALKVTLLGDVATRIELGGTRNSAAFDSYLRGRKTVLDNHGGNDPQTAVKAFTEAIQLDPNYALAYANRSLALGDYAGTGDALGPEARESYDESQADALKAIALAPDLAEGHVALAYHFETGALDFTRANEHYERALALTAGNARVLRDYGTFAVFMGRTEAGIAAVRRAVVLDPLSSASHANLGQVLYNGRQNQEAIAAFKDALTLDPEYLPAYPESGLAYYALGEFEHARAWCAKKPDFWWSEQCLAVTYDKLARHTDAESMLAKLKAEMGDGAAYQYATIYAQWGNQTKALEWLDSAIRLRDPGVEQLKTDPLMDPLRKEPRFQAVVRELKFPE